MDSPLSGHTMLVVDDDSSVRKEQEVSVEKVLGFGGFFFRANDPKMLARWYSDHSGVDETPPTYGFAYWR
jgi:hypothetical protein